MRFILGLRYHIFQLVGTHIESFCNYSTMVDNARMMEIGENKWDDFQLKCKRGLDEDPRDRVRRWGPLSLQIGGTHHQQLPQHRFGLQLINPIRRWYLKGANPQWAMEIHNRGAVCLSVRNAGGSTLGCVMARQELASHMTKWAISRKNVLS